MLDISWWSPSSPALLVPAFFQSCWGCWFPRDLAPNPTLPASPAFLWCTLKAL
jgi:hypothetical protein